jgi:hypothetical protein
MELSESERIGLIESACEAEEVMDIDELEWFANNLNQKEADLIADPERGPHGRRI